MQVDFPGDIKPFAELEPGEFFIFFDENRPAFAMKIYDDSVENVPTAPKKVGVLSFSLAVHPMTPPTLVDIASFKNRDVLSVRDVVIRPLFGITKLRNDSPPQQSGPIMFAGDGVFIRAWPDEGSAPLDVNLQSGATAASFAHPGGMWVDDWEIVLVGQNVEYPLCRRAPPSAAS